MQNLFTDEVNKANIFAYLSNNQPAHQSRISLQCKQISNTLGSNSKLVLLIQRLHCKTSIVFLFSSIYVGIYETDAL